MELQITGKNIELTSRVRQYVARKMNKLTRHLPNILDTKVEIVQEKTKAPEQHFVVRVTVNATGIQLHGEERGIDLFTAIDKVADIMIRQEEDYKTRINDKGRGVSLARGVPEVIETPPPAIREVVKLKRFSMKPMSVTEAAGQMETLGHDFYVFYNTETEEINVLYRRKDGNYGLIEPELG